MNAAKKKPNAKRNERRAVVSAQQTIPYVAMHPDGICQLPGGLYTKTVEYEDINYAVASTEDQTAIFGGWSSFLNYFDNSKRFLAQHEAELADYRAAKATLNDLLDGAKLPKMAQLKEKHRKLAAEKKTLYAKYRAAQQEMRQAVAVKTNIDYLLGVTDGRKNKEQER